MALARPVIGQTCAAVEETKRARRKSRGRVTLSVPVNFYPRDAIYNEAVEMQTRLHFLRTYETYPRIIQARPIVRIHSIFRL